MKMKAIGHIKSPFKQKFGIPRQGALVPESYGEIHFTPEISMDYFEGLEVKQSLWLIFLFHHNKNQAARAKVRLPRLGGNKRLGVFASRSPYRPNPLGLSLVTFEALEKAVDGVVMKISGHDLLDGTPVLDIKPHLAYADQLSGPSPFAVPKSYPVDFTPEALGIFEELERANPGLANLVKKMASYDPRPSYSEEAKFAFEVEDWDVRCLKSVDSVRVVELVPKAGRLDFHKRR